jgi:hypothetical protein
MKLTRLLTPLIVALCLIPTGSPAQWTTDTSANTIVADGSGNQVDPKLVPDGTGGVIVAWREFRPGTGYDIYAQRIDTLGFRKWPTGGVAICTLINDSYDLNLAPDGHGGALLVWRDYRSGTSWDIYAQRIDTSGTVAWTPDGAPVCVATQTQDGAQIVSDGTGGAIIAWRDFRSATDFDIYAQRIDSAGSAVWAADGVPVCATGEHQINPQAVSDGGGGAIIAWQDLRSSTNYDIYAQRIDPSGTTAWTSGGIPVSIAAHDQVNPRAVSDAAGRTVIAWEDARSGTNWDIYAQRINTSGVLMWNAQAESVCTSPLSQVNIGLADDGAGGAFISWQDDRNALSTDVYAQHFNGFGGETWTHNGVGVCTDSGHQFAPKVLADGEGGAYFTWHDSRFGTSYDIYAQRIDGSGSPMWGVNGREIGVAAANQLDPAIETDGAGGAIITWEDGRSGDFDIYLQNLLPDGTLGILPSITASAGPNGTISPPGATGVPFGGSQEYTFTPNTGYHVDSVYVNGSYIGSPAGYTFTNVTINSTIRVVFAINVYHITATAGPNGSISQAGVTAVIHGQTQAYSITPDSGFNIGMVIIDGADSGTPPSHIFTNITRDHSISAYFTNDSTSLVFVGGRWNMVSVPSVVGDYSKSVLFPSATTDAFYFDGAYQTGTVMDNGPGYWLKFDSAEVLSLIGSPLTIDTFNVMEGWNMVGSISKAVPIPNITSIPPGIVTSQFFGYSTGYSVASSISPCRGYWVKASQAGSLILSSAPVAVPAGRIRIVPSEELPPAPPDGVVSGVPDVTGGSGTVPDGYSLDQNYPNPFNPVTTIRYGLPVDAVVKIDIFNVAGERIGLLDEGYHEAGSYSTSWNGSHLPSGVYFYRIRAGAFSEVKKMVLLK